MAFVHLRTHTEYSIVDGTLRIDDMVSAASADRQPALAITDLNNLFGAIKFYSSARKKGLQPIIGADIWLKDVDSVANSGTARPPSRLLLLVQNAVGYRNLCELLARGWTSNTQQAQSQLEWSWLAEHADGLIALSGADKGAIGQALLMGDKARAQQLAAQFAQLFAGRFYIELQRAGLPNHEPYVRAAVPLAAELGLPIVATHPIQFATADDFEAHEARVCIAEGETLGNPRRAKHFSREQYFKTTAQMQALFADLPSALENTVYIAQRCSLSLVLGKPQLPNFPTPIQADGTAMPMAAYFRLLAQEGLQERLVQLFPDEASRTQRTPLYSERLEFEIETILKMGFPGYFLIVADFINWAKQHGCPVGPGRGSGAGSLVAYALKITDLDPLRYNLLFERFLNPERVSMPDFDIDFCQANRDRVIDYVKTRYGRDAVSQIATFGTMAAKAALRDVGRVLGMGYGHVDGIAKLIPTTPGKTVTLARVTDPHDTSVVYARKEAPELEEREKNEEEVAELLSLAMRVEGLVRNIGMHAGGVLIAPGKITDFCPLYMQPGSDSAVSQYDKDDVEAVGLVKFDFLGLATLTILETAKEFIIERYAEQRDFDFANLPLTDKGTFDLLSEGKTVAVFQLESRGMQGMLRDARPSVFEDIIALVALYRPGPMDLIPSFCARKHGREEVTYPHPLMETVLNETYGIMVYQEQVMQVAQRLGDYSLGGADLLRRAMGKKKPEEMAQHRILFAQGAAKNNISPDLANEIFDVMEKFAGYGFNKSHAAAYALLAYHTAWLKVHYPAEFFAANMSVSIDDTDKLKIFFDDACENFAIHFEPPNINTGRYRFQPIDSPSDAAKTERGRIRYGLGAIKGTGQGAIEALVAEREQNGPFKSFFDFCARTDKSRINKRVVEALIKGGAFDSLEPNRAALLASVGLGFEYAQNLAAHEHQGGLFDFADSGDQYGSARQEPSLVATPAWSIKEGLTYEKSAIGFYLSGHLFDQYAKELRQITLNRIADLTDNREPQILAGIISDLRVINGQRGRVAIFQLDDKSGLIEVVANEELLDAHRSWLQEDALIILQAKVQPDRFSGGLRLNAQQIWDLPAARCRFGRFLKVALKDDTKVTSIQSIVQRYPPQVVAGATDTMAALGLAVRVSIQCAGTTVGAQVELDLDTEALFFPCDEAIDSWRQIACNEEVAIIYHSGRA